MDQKVHSQDLGRHSDLERSLRRIVRAVIRRGHGESRLSRQILDVAESLPETAGRSTEQVVNQVCRKICETIASGPPAAALLGIPQFETIHGRFDTASTL